MNTLHRKDITAADFKRLAAFCAALQSLEDENGFELYLVLDAVTMLLPVWYCAGNGWLLSRYKQFDRQAIWIEAYKFRRICNYLRVRESVLVQLLYRMSMLGVVADQTISARPRFRQPTWCRTDEGWKQDSVGTLGFILEARRALGDFRKGEAASE